MRADRRRNRAVHRPVGVIKVEFISEGEVSQLLKSHGITQVPEDEDHVYCRMGDEAASNHVHLCVPDAAGEPRDGAQVYEIEPDRMEGVLNHVLHKLHHNQFILIPVGKWRSIFDAVAFSLAENEEWQAIDAAATVELNTRDPLLADAGDLHLLCDLVGAIIRDSETPDHGLMMITAGVPVVLELVSAGVVRMSFGNQAVAEEVAEAFTA